MSQVVLFGGRAFPNFDERVGFLLTEEALLLRSGTCTEGRFFRFEMSRTEPLPFPVRILRIEPPPLSSRCLITLETRLDRFCPKTGSRLAMLSSHIVDSDPE